MDIRALNEFSGIIRKAVDDYNMIQEGDRIDIDIPNKRMNLRLSEDALRARHDAFVAPERPALTGYLRRYAAMVSSADQGAVFQ